MSGYRKALKVFSVIEIILAVLALLAALASLGVIALGPSLTSETVSADGVTMTIGQTFAMFGALMLVSGLIDLLVGLLGVRAANNPKKSGAYFVLAIIGFAFDVIELVLTVISMVQGTSNMRELIVALISAAVSGLIVFIVSKIRSEAE